MKQSFSFFDAYTPLNWRACVLANSECSQKLMIWKHDETKRKKRDKRKSAKLIVVPKLIITEEKPSIAENPKKLRKKK